MVDVRQDPVGTWCGRAKKAVKVGNGNHNSRAADATEGRDGMEAPLAECLAIG